MRLTAIIAMAVLLGLIGAEASAQTCTPVTVGKSYTTHDDGNGPSDSIVLGGTANGTLTIGPDLISGYINDHGGFGGCGTTFSSDGDAGLILHDNTTGANLINESAIVPNIGEFFTNCTISCAFSTLDRLEPTAALTSGHSYTVTSSFYAITTVGDSQTYDTSVSFTGYTDPFNCPNGSQPQSPWAVKEGTFQCGGNNQLIFWSGTSGILLYNVSISNDQCTTITLGTGLPSLTGAWAAYARLAADASSMYYGEFYSNGTSSNSAFYLGKLVNGTYTTLGGTLHSFATGDSLTTCARGTDISLLYNGTKVLGVTDTSLTSGYPGIGVNGANGVSLEGFQALTNIH